MLFSKKLKKEIERLKEENAELQRQNALLKSALEVEIEAHNNDLVFFFDMGDEAYMRLSRYLRALRLAYTDGNYPTVAAHLWQLLQASLSRYEYDRVSRPEQYNYLRALVDALRQMSNIKGGQ